jgi:hypothetical protein
MSIHSIVHALFARPPPVCAQLSGLSAGLKFLLVKTQSVCTVQMECDFCLMSPFGGNCSLTQLPFLHQFVLREIIDYFAAFKLQSKNC